MALLYHQRFLVKTRSLLSTILTSYDPFGHKLLEHFRANPYYPFTCTQPYTFEYKYRHWSTIYFLVFLQLLICIITLYSAHRFRISEYWLSGSEFLLLFSFGLLSIFPCVNLIENFKQRRIVLSPLDFYVSIYVGNILKGQCHIDRAYICLHQIESYRIVLYHLVFNIEDVDSIQISDYFSSELQLSQIGKRLAQNLYIGYLESEDWLGIFPKYQKLQNYVRKRTVHADDSLEDLSTRANSNESQRKRKLSSSHTVLDL